MSLWSDCYLKNDILHSRNHVWAKLSGFLKALTTAQRDIGDLYLEYFRLPPAGPTPLLSTEFPVQSDASEEELGLSWDGYMWAVPKKRTSYSKKRMRNSQKYLRPKTNYSACPKCGSLKMSHVLCGPCLKETLMKTAEMRRKELEEKLNKVKEIVSDKFPSSN